MKRHQEKLKEEFLAEAEELFDQLMEWEGENDRPNLAQIEDIVLELRKRFGEQLAEKVLLRQEQRQPAERVEAEGTEGEPGRESGGRLENRTRTLLLPRLPRWHFSPWMNNCCCGRNIGVNRSPNKPSG
jgi:hypothetical protein